MFDIKSHMDGTELNRPSFSLVGYQFLSLSNNMGILFWFLIIFMGSLVVKWGLNIFESKVHRALQ